jgi:hypothetical protein
VNASAASSLTATTWSVASSVAACGARLKPAQVQPRSATQVARKRRDSRRQCQLRWTGLSGVRVKRPARPDLPPSGCAPQMPEGARVGFAQREPSGSLALQMRVRATGHAPPSGVAGLASRSAGGASVRIAVRSVPRR